MRGFHPRIVQRRALLEAHILQHLRQRLEQMRRLADAGFPSCASTASTCSAAISPSPVVEKSRQDDMAGLFAADIEAALVHLLQHIAVAHRGARQRQVQRSQITIQPGIRHHRADHAAALELAAFRPALGDQGQDLVAVDDAGPFRRPSPPGRHRRPARCRNRRALRAPWRTSPGARSSRNPD